MVVCPITSKSKGYVVGLTIAPVAPVWGVVLSDDVNSVDWHSRGAKGEDRVLADTVQRTCKK